MSELEQPRVFTEPRLHFDVTETFFRFDGCPEALSWSVRKAMCEWCKFHGIDPERVPETSFIRRDLDRCAVLVEQFLTVERHPVGASIDLDALTEPRRFQGETPPMPWPAEVLELANGGVRADPS